MALARQNALNRLDARTKFRRYVMDEDTNNKAFDDADVDAIIMDVYQKIWVRQGDYRVASVSSSSLWNGTSGNNALSSTYAWDDELPVFKILRVYREVGASAVASSASLEMERMERDRLLWLQRNRPTPTSLPRCYSLEKTDTLSTDTTNRYRLRIWPVANAATNALGTYFSADVIYQPPVSFDDDADFFDLDVEAANQMVRAAAAIAAPRMGWPAEFVEGLWRTIPQDLQEYLNARHDASKPRVYAGEEP